MTTWTKVNKPSGTSWTAIPKATSSGTSRVISTLGSPIGLLLALTYSQTSSIITGGGWTKITKATGTGWTKITKAT